jgi:hypothetical protein
LWFAADPASMVRAVEGALDAPADVSTRRAWARQHDWNALAARMVGEIEARAAAAS